MQVKEWNISQVDSQIVQRLVKDLNISDDIAKLLVKRGIYDFDSAKDFFRPNLSKTYDPFLMKDMSIAVDRINQAKKNNEILLVYGDYDVDGTTSVAMISLFLTSIEIEHKFYCPDRYNEGYGISKNGVDYAIDENISLIIALDCGIRDIESISYARSKGIDVIVCDHHKTGDKLPNANAILNPKQKNCNYPFKELCGCGVGFKLISALHIKNKISVDNTLKYLDFVAVATLADIVPVVDENRIFAFHGILKLNNSPNPGFTALISKLSSRRGISSSEILFGLAPMINSAGRIAHANLAVKLLISDNTEELNRYSENLFSLNQKRKKIESEIYNDALNSIDYDLPATVLCSNDWHKGVIGIVASKLIEKHYRPTIIFSEKNGLLTGSARSVKGFNIYDAIDKCKDLCERFGGHKYAAGLTVKKENYESFKSCFLSIVSKKITEDQMIQKIDIDLQFDLNKLDNKFYRILKQFSPFGPGNPKPVFKTHNLNLKSPPVLMGIDKRHIKFLLDLKNTNFQAVGFNLAQHIGKLESNKINLCYTIDENIWNNKKTLQLLVKDFF